MCLMSKQKEDKLLAWLLQGPGIFSTTERRQEAEAEQRVCVCVCVFSAEQHNKMKTMVESQQKLYFYSEQTIDKG